MVLVLEGRVTAWCDGTEVALSVGDFMGFPPGDRHAHHLKNDGDSPAYVLVIASPTRGDSVVNRTSRAPPRDDIE